MKKKVIIYPARHSKHNLYIDNLYHTICDEYDVVGYDEVKKQGVKSILSADIYHLNWYENVKKAKVFKKKIFIYVLKLLNKKIIWTVHNNVPHEENVRSKYIKIYEVLS